MDEQLSFDRYQIDSVIGEGGWGRVFKARHTSLGTPAAIKVLHAHLVADPEKLQRFEQEAKAACSLHHPNIAEVFDFGYMPNGQPYLVMDLFDGESLDKVLSREGKLDIARAVKLFKQICDGLAAAHRKGIVHRDVKPENIMLLRAGSPDEQVKLVDFGLSKSTGPTGSGLNNLTQTGEVLGTPAYMSPEQCLGVKVDARSDIYSLGCVMYEVVTGKKAFDAPTPYECMRRHFDEPPPLPSHLVPPVRLPAELENVIFKCLEKESGNRYPDASAVGSALDKVEAHAGTTGRQQMKALIERRRREIVQTVRAHRTSYLAATISLTMLAGGSLALYMKAKQEDPMNLPPPQRWTYFIQAGTQALDKGEYKEAEKNLQIAENIAVDFPTRDRLRITLDNQAILYHILHAQEQELAADRKLGKLPTPAPRAQTLMALKANRPPVNPADVAFLSELLDKVTASGHPDKEELASLGERINALARQNPKGTLPLLEKSQQLLKKYIGANNDIYCSSTYTLGTAYYDDRQYEKAVQCLEEAVNAPDINRHNSAYLMLLDKLGTAYERLDRLDKVEQCWKQTTALLENVENVGLHIQALSNLCVIYEREGKWIQARDTWKQLLQLNEANNLYSAFDFYGLRYLYASINSGNRDQAELYFKTRRQQLISQFGRDDERVGAYTYCLAELYMTQGRYDQARDCAREALRIYHNAHVPDLWIRAAEQMLARTSLAKQDYAAALPLYKFQLALIERNWANEPDQGLLLEALSKEAYCNLKLNNRDAAARDMRQFAIVVNQLVPAASEYDCTRAIDQAFTELDGFGLRKAQLIKLADLINAQEAVRERDSSLYRVPTARLHDALARIYGVMGKWYEAEKEEKQSIELLNKPGINYFWMPGLVYSYYAKILSTLNDPDQSKEYYEKATSFPIEPI